MKKKVNIKIYLLCFLVGIIACMIISIKGLDRTDDNNVVSEEINSIDNYVIDNENRPDIEVLSNLLEKYNEYKEENGNDQVTQKYEEEINAIRSTMTLEYGRQINNNIVHETDSKERIVSAKSNLNFLLKQIEKEKNIVFINEEFDEYVKKVNAAIDNCNSYLYKIGLNEKQVSESEAESQSVAESLAIAESEAELQEITVSEAASKADEEASSKTVSISGQQKKVTNDNSDQEKSSTGRSDTNKSNEITQDKTNANTEAKEPSIQLNCLLVAHRGASKYRPENTMPAFEYAIESGYKAIETDVQETKDGHFILNHNSTINAMTNGEGKIYAMTLEQVLSYNVDNGNGINNYPDLKLCRLEDFLELCKKNNVEPNLEIKDVYDLDAFYKVLCDCGIQYDCKIVSFSARCLNEIKDMDNEITIMYLGVGSFTTSTLDELKYKYKACYYNSTEYWNEDLLQYCQSIGLKASVGVIDDIDKFKIYNDMGFDTITTNSIKADCLSD